VAWPEASIRFFFLLNPSESIIPLPGEASEERRVTILFFIVSDSPVFPPFSGRIFPLFPLSVHFLRYFRVSDVDTPPLSPPPPLFFPPHSFSPFLFPSSLIPPLSFRFIMLTRSKVEKNSRSDRTALFIHESSTRHFFSRLEMNQLTVAPQLSPLMLNCLRLCPYKVS